MLENQSHIEPLEARQLLSAAMSGSFTGKIPGAISLKSPTRLTVKLVNTGGVAISGPATLNIFASQDSVFDSGDALIAGEKVKLNLKPGKSSTATISFSAPSAISSGSYRLVGEIVPSSAPPGIFFSASSVAITAPFVNLGGTIALSPKTTSYTVGGKGVKPLSVTVIVVNHGNVPARGPVAIALYGSTNAALDALDPLLTTVPAKAITLNPGKSKKYVINLKPTAATPSGTYLMLANINAGITAKTAIVESTLDDNTPATPNTFKIINGAKPQKAAFAGALTDNILAVVVGSPELTTFSASIANAGPSTSVELDEVDSSGNLIGAIASMSDDGSVANGDQVAGDGTYSANVPIGFDAAGTRYFVAKVVDTTQSVSAQTAAISIPGVTGPTQQQFAADDADAITVRQAAAPVVAAHGTAAQIIAAVNGVLQSDANVQPGSIRTVESAIAWDSVDGIGHAILTDELLGCRGASAGTTTVIQSAGRPASAGAVTTPVIKSSAAARPNGRTAVVIDPYNATFTEDGGDEAPAIAQKLTDAGYDTTYLGAAQLNSLSQYQNLGTNAALVFVAHGIIIPNMGSYLATRVLATEDAKANHLSDLENHRLILNDDSVAADGTGTSSYLAQSGFFKAYTGSMDGSIVYLGACHLAENQDMAQAFLGLKAGAVIAYTGFVKSPFAVPHGLATFDTLLKDTKNTVGDIPGINVDVVTAPPKTSSSRRTSGVIFNPDGLTMGGGSNVLNRFLSFGDLKAVLPGKPKLKAVNLVVTYSWPNTQRDLDTRTAFGGGAAGFDITAGTYLNWLGDQQGAGLQETTIVDLYDAWKAGIFSTTTVVGAGADWYAPDKGKGPATISVALEDITTEKQYEIQTLVINPATETTGATSQQGTIAVTLGGDPTDPTVTIKLVNS